MALDSVAKHLATPHGMVLQDPPHADYHVEMGEVTSYPPGYKENGGIFCHNNPWIIIAEAMLGNAERAFDYYTRIAPAYREQISEVHRLEPYVYAQMIAGKAAPRHGEAKNSWLTGTAAWNYVAINYTRIAPAYREQISEVHRLEPYVYAQMIAGKAAPRHGEAKNSWLTGTAAWNYVAITQHILGIRPGFSGLTINPCVPASLGEIKVTRHFRGCEYRITIRPARPGEAKGLTVNGQPSATREIPPQPGGALDITAVC